MTFGAIIKGVIFSSNIITVKISQFISATFHSLSYSESTALLALIYASAFYLTILFAEKIGKPLLKAVIMAASVWLIIGIFK